ncbi:MAG: GDSL-type esterase/lipase family protein [Chitinophagaceae bacterium]
MRKDDRLLVQLAFYVLAVPVFFLLAASAKPGNHSPKVVFADTGIVLSRSSSIKSYLALGDSYTIGQSVPKNERYPAQTVAMLRTAGYSNLQAAEIIATSGWTTGNLLQALKNKSYYPNYDLVTLLIGVNNQYQGGSLQQYRSQFSALLVKSIRFAGNRPNRVIVLSIPDYSVTPFATSSDRKKIARDIDSFNVVNKHIADHYKVNYLNVTEESRKAAQNPSLIAYDGLHFSGKEYTVWTSMLVAKMMEVLK